MPPKSRKGGTKESSKSKKNKETNDCKLELTPAEIAAENLRNKGIVCTFAQNAKKQHANDRDISVSNITVTFHGAPLLEETELSLNYGNRYGFIGRNGCGKSTFMDVIAARCFPIPDNIDIYHVSEEIEASDMTAKEAVMSVDTETAKLEAEAEALNDKLADAAGDGEDEDDSIMDRLNQVYERLEEMDASTAEARASKILCGLGFTAEKQNKKTKEFSGGWRMRIALARALFIQPTLLLLDEPTNHLDMEAVVWLEDYLAQWKKILFLVSHSQDFMNTVCTNIIHFHRKKLTGYGGNYDTFVNTRRELDEEQSKRFKAEQDQIQHMKDYVAKFGQGNAKMARQAQSKEKTLDKMVRGGLTEKVEKEKALDFVFPDPGNLAPPVLQCNDITFGYPGCPILYSNVDFGVDLDSRIALVGPNGAGKSTLLKLITGEILPLTGAVRPHAHLRFSKFSQHFIDVLDLEMCPIDYFMSLWPKMSREDARKYLGRFGCSGDVQTQKMEQLSDGQKSRVVFAKMAKECPHLLLLDEPTNHLDMESIDSLAKAINNYTGGMMLVSHDMRLISQVAREIWVVDNLTVSKYIGEIKDFKMDIRRQMQKDNLIAGSSESAGQTQSKVKLVPLSSKHYTTAKAPLVAPAAVKANADFPVLSASSSSVTSEEDAIRKARLELADIAIAKQRSRQSAPQGAMATPVEATEMAPPAPVKVAAAPPAPPVETEESISKAEEKARAKEERKRLKEMISAREALEEADREKRKKEKEEVLEAARKLKEEMDAAREERDIKRKAEKDEERRVALEELEMQKQAALARRAEREARKAAKVAARLAQLEAEQAELKNSVLTDVWTQNQQLALESALLKYDWHMDRTERWNAISKAIPPATSTSSASVAYGHGKTRNQCLRRYTYIKDLALKMVHPTSKEQE